MILGYGITMVWNMIDGQSTFSLHGVMRLFLRDLFLKMMNNIFLQIILKVYGNVSSLILERKLI